MTTDLNAGLNTDLLAIIQKIKHECGENPGKKQLQKLVYLIQAKGVSLGYEYDIHFYGPYSEELSHDLLSLCVHCRVDFSVEGQTHKIVPFDKEPVEMTLSKDHSAVVDNLIRQYKDISPSELELITTTHFVAENLGSSEEEILAGVKRIKGNKYPERDIKDVVRHIKAEYAV